MNRLSRRMKALMSVKMGKEYLDGVLVNILAAEAGGLDPEKLRIRIGVTGQGSRPNYRGGSSELEGFVIEVTIPINSPSGGSMSVKQASALGASTRHFAGLTTVRWLNLMTSECHER